MDNTTIQLKWTYKGYLPSTVNKELWENYLEAASGGFVAHDTMCHRPNETGTSWEEARAIGATIAIYRNKFPSAEIIRIAEADGRWIDAPAFEIPDKYAELYVQVKQHFYDFRWHTNHYQHWVDWFTIGYIEALEIRPFTHEMIQRVLELPFKDWHKVYPQTDIELNLLTGEYKFLTKQLGYGNI